MDALWQLLFKTDSFVEGYGQENNNKIVSKEYFQQSTKKRKGRRRRLFFLVFTMALRALKLQLIQACFAVLSHITVTSSIKLQKVVGN